MEQLIAPILETSPTVIYVIVGWFAFCEAAVFVGLLVPGGIVAALAGVLAAQGRVSLLMVVLVGIAGAIAGDSVSYEIGRRWGPRLASWPRMRRYTAKLRATAGVPTEGGIVSWLERRGAVVVFLARWTGVVGTLVPSVAGMVRMPYGRFLAANTLGGIGWGVLYPLLGYATGESFRVIEGWLGGVSWVLAGVLTLAIIARVVVVRVRRGHQLHALAAAKADDMAADDAVKTEDRVAP